MTSPLRTNLPTTAASGRVAVRPDTAARRRRDRWGYVLCDLVAAALAWNVFVGSRALREGQAFADVVADPNYLYAAVGIPLAWVGVYALFDQYRDIYRLSRLTTLAHTLLLSCVGVLVIFFTLLLDDAVGDYHDYYQGAITLFTAHFLLTATVRMIC